MRLVVQRTSQAGVTVEGEVIGKTTDAGLLLLVGVAPDDDQNDIDWLVNKVLTLKLFEDDEGRLKRSIEDVKGQFLVVSQFTLYADVRKGTVPSWSDAAKPEVAEKLYGAFVRTLGEKTDLLVETGQFQAHMNVALINDGPLTIIIDSPR